LSGDPAEGQTRPLHVLARHFDSIGSMGDVRSAATRPVRCGLPLLNLPSRTEAAPMTLLALGFWPGFAAGIFVGMIAAIFVAALMTAAVAADRYSYRGVPRSG
jgi:predicted anti-sigma-YlaC factor YlaD